MQRLQRGKETGGHLSIFCIDLYDFKQVNDTHGYAMGDKLLRSFAARLLSSVRSADMVARLGADEFAVALEGLARPCTRQRAAERHALQFRARGISDPVVLEERRMTRHTKSRHVSPRKLPCRRRMDAAIEALPPVIVEHPHGFYWIAVSGMGELGPFETDELARTNRGAASEAALAPEETLRQVDREMGTAAWIDAETGEPAEGASPPHLPQE